MDKKRVIGLTMGDAAGVGPELCLRVLQTPSVLALCRPVVFGSAALLRRVAKICGLPFDAEILSPSDWINYIVAGEGPAVVVDDDELDAMAVKPGCVQAVCGAAAYRCVAEAIQAACRGVVQAVVTTPIHKEALQLAGIPYPGHTEIFATLTSTKNYCMMMASADINVCLATTHIPLSQVPRQLSVERVLDVIRLADFAMRRLGKTTPRLTVCGLNPHAGEHGLFGDEEVRLIQPAVDVARTSGIVISGPLPPDTAFIPTVRKRTDAYIVMYHDQGLIPFKMLAFDVGVNVTLGLPIVRTSVDHGTAFDIAWQGKASESSLIEAIRTAIRLQPAL